MHHCITTLPVDTISDIVSYFDDLRDLTTILLLNHHFYSFTHHSYFRSLTFQLFEKHKQEMEERPRVNKRVSMKQLLRVKEVQSIKLNRHCDKNWYQIYLGYMRGHFSRYRTDVIIRNLRDDYSLGEICCWYNILTCLIDCDEPLHSRLLYKYDSEEATRRIENYYAQISTLKFHTHLARKIYDAGLPLGALPHCFVKRSSSNLPNCTLYLLIQAYGDPSSGTTTSRNNSRYRVGPFTKSCLTLQIPQHYSLYHYLLINHNHSQYCIDFISEITERYIDELKHEENWIMKDPNKNCEYKYTPLVHAILNRVLQCFNVLYSVPEFKWNLNDRFCVSIEGLQEVTADYLQLMAINRLHSISRIVGYLELQDSEDNYIYDISSKVTTKNGSVLQSLNEVTLEQGFGVIEIMLLSLIQFRDLSDGMLRLFKLMINRGMNMNMKLQGRTLLSYVVGCSVHHRHDNLKRALEILMSNGADPYLENNDGSNCFDILRGRTSLSTLVQASKIQRRNMVDI